MAYIGKGLVGVLSQSKAVDTMTGDGSDTTLTLSRTPGSVNNVEVYMDGVFQTPGVEYTLSGNTVSFSTAPETGTEIIALIGNDSTIITPSNDSISGTKIAGAVVTDAKIAGMASNKLTGALPAVDGSALTNIPSSVTKSASDPATDSNPAGGVGTIWANTTSGEMYVLTDATAGSNVWTNIGAGTGDVEPWAFGGTISGYASGGAHSTATVNTIDKFSLVSDADATDVGDLTSTIQNVSGQSSSTHGYTSGGYPPNDRIDKFSFTVDGNATDIANLTVGRYYPTGHSSETHGYTSGGAIESPNTKRNEIDKFTFASDADATDVGDLTVNAFGRSGTNSPTHGYSSGGTQPAHTDVIDKFSFVADGNATDIGNLTVVRSYSGNQSSSTHGYTAGGRTNPNVNTNIIDKFTFASDADATDVGDLTTTRGYSSGQSSTTHGYISGNYLPGWTNMIEKFSFTVDGNATDIANLTVARGGTAGTQV